MPPVRPPPAPAVFTWQAVRELSDEFNRNALDQTKWLPKIPYWNGREPSAYDPANVSVEDGILHLRKTTTVTTLDGIKNPEKDLTALRPAAQRLYSWHRHPIIVSASSGPFFCEAIGGGTVPNCGRTCHALHQERINIVSTPDRKESTISRRELLGSAAAMATTNQFTRYQLRPSVIATGLTTLGPTALVNCSTEGTRS